MTVSNIPQKIGRYQISRELGRGGMGIVYLAHDPFIDRQVAIKTTLSSPPKDPQSLEKFQKKFFSEARAAGKLTHPHIISLYNATVENDRCYLIMEFVDGFTLKEYCRGEKMLPLEKVLKIIFQCAKALDYAHKNGVIHHDIKPSNIMLSQGGEAKISDFGIATVEEFSNTPKSGDFTGSAHYTSPEQLRDELLTPQTDLFCLGVVLYELLTGCNPFASDSDIATFFKISNEDPQSLKQYRRDVPESLERIVMRTLEKDLTKRYRTCLQLASELSASFDHLRFMDEEINSEEKLNALKAINFFKDFTSSELVEVINATQWFEYETNSTIITEGEIEDCFYIIVTGKVLVKKRGKPLAILKKGDCFGEMAYLGKIKRTATIEAVVNTILMKINASLIEQTSIGTQLRFYKVFSNTLISRLNHTSELLSKKHS